MPSLMAILGLDGSRFRAGLASAKAQAAAAGQQITSHLGTRVAGALAGVASVAALERAIQGTVEWGDRISVLSQRLGISTDAVQAWDYALQMSNSSIDQAAAFFEKLATARKKALAGDPQAIASFRALGVALGDLKSKRIEDLAAQIARAFEIGDPQRLIGALREVGGRGAGELVAAFRDGLSGLLAEAPKVGESVIESLRDAADQSKRIWMEMRAGMAPVVAFAAKLGEGLWRGLQVGGTGLVALLQTGSLKEAGNEVEMLKTQWREADEDAAKRAANRKKPMPGGDVGTGEDEKKAAQERERSAQRVARLKYELMEMEQRHILAALTKEQQVQELYRRRAELAAFVAANYAKMSAEGKIQAQIDLERLSGEEAGAQRELDRAKNKPEARAAAFHASVNALQAIGAYAAAPSFEARALRVHEQNGTRLDKIEGHLARIEGRAGQGARF